MDFLNTDMVMMDKTTKPDPEFGGILTVWKEGAAFRANLVPISNTEIRIAEQQGAKALYTIVTDQKVMLSRGDFVRRVSDKATYRVTADSADMAVPAFSSIRYAQCPAERVVL